MVGAVVLLEVNNNIDNNVGDEDNDDDDDNNDGNGDKDKDGGGGVVRALGSSSC